MKVFASDLQYLSRADKRAYREDGIRNAMKLAMRINAEYGEVTPWTIHLHCPEATPRLRAMIRHVALNNDVVDTPHPHED